MARPGAFGLGVAAMAGRGKAWRGVAVGAWQVRVG
jgi:hypothetical protein